MIKYAFMYNLKDNSFIFKLPDEDSEKYGTPVENSLSKLNFSEMVVLERKEVKFGTKNKLYISKTSKQLIIGIIATREKPKRSVFALISEIYQEIKQTKNINKNIKKWISEEIQAHNKGERMDATEKLKKKADFAQNRVKEVKTKAEEQGQQLVRIDDNVRELKDEAKTYRDNAVAVYLESWWYNHKLEIMMYGGVVVIGICIFIYVFRLLL